MYCSLQKIKGQKLPFRRQLRLIYSATAKRILTFMRKYWLVFCIFIPIGFALGVYQAQGFWHLLGNFISYYHDYNGAWWYVLQYIFMIFLLPMIDLFFDFVFVKQYRSIKTAAMLLVQGVFYALLFFLLFPMRKNAMYYTLVFVIGYLCSRFDIFSKVKKTIKEGTASYIIGWLLLISTVIIRFLLARNPGHIGSDVVLAPIFCFAVCLLTRRDGKITNFFAWLGKYYSVYMWLTHNFFWLYFFPKFSTFSHISTIIYLQLVLVSLLTSAILFFLEKQLCALCTRIFRRKVNASAN